MFELILTFVNKLFFKICHELIDFEFNDSKIFEMVNIKLQKLL